METAITMPMFIFLLLGMLQLGLLHQARVMTKYAAYRAVRVGSIHNAKHSAMIRAALGALLPFSGRQGSMSFFRLATPGGGEGSGSMTGDFSNSWSEAVRMNEPALQGPVKGNVDPKDRIVDVMVCEPYTRNGFMQGDFDDPEGGMAALTIDEASREEIPENVDPSDPNPSAYNWRQYNAGRLTVQVTFYHRMVIPFVNGVIWHTSRGDASTTMMRTLRMGTEDEPRRGNSGRLIEKLDSLAARGVYVMPIRASWSMRMQSNFIQSGSDFELPADNECIIPWSK